MPTVRPRLVVDTNLWISFLLTRSRSKLERIISDPSVSLLFSEELLEEFMTVALRPKFKKYFSDKDLEELLFSLHQKAEIIHVRAKTTVCRDEKDNFILALCADGKATHLVTGDGDLLSLKKFGRTKIVRLSELKVPLL